MKQKRLILVMALLCLFAGNVLAQNEPCGFDRIRTYHRSLDSLHFDAKEGAHTARIQYYRENPRPLQQVNHGYYQPMSNGLYPMLVVPVAVHVFHAAADNTVGTGTNISQAQIDNQLTALNDAFDTLGIQFCVVAVTRHNDNGINHKVDSQLQVTSLRNVVYYNPDSVLNLYVVRSILENNNTESTLAGYNNSLPGIGRIDAVVVRYNRFGNYNTCSGCPLSTDARGITTVHEVGHYLGLWHTFQDACSGGIDSADCAHKGDRCCDTPPHIQPSASGCSTSPNTCNETYNGNLGDPKNNYMNYTGEDCMSHFTPDQLSIMLSLLNGPRAVLVSPGNLNRWGNACVNGSAFFGYDKSFLCSADTVHFTAYQQTGAQYKWNVYSDSVTYNGAFGSNYTFNYVFTKQTSYTVTLTVIFGTDTIMFTDSNAVTLADCGTPIASEQGNWYFGYYGGLNFNTVIPVADFGPINNFPLNINTEEGTISQSNAQGQLLFYGGGEPEYFTIGSYQTPLSGIFRVYDRNYTEMANSPIIGDHSSVQAGIVLPHPTQGHKYYIFTVTGGEGDKTFVSAPDHRGFRYSIIDTVLNDIDTNFKNVPIVVPISGHEHSGFDSALVSGEMITAIPKCNGTDYWVLVKGGFTPAYRYDRLLIFSLDSTGVSFHSYKDSVFDGYIAQQMLVASSNGMFVATASRLLDFDKSTGTVTRIREKTYAYSFGMNFSPNSRYLYQFEGATTKLYQYDLRSNILNETKQEIYNYGFLTTEHIQRGPDDKLYINNYNLDFLSVINFPDSGCNASEKNKCGFVYKGPSLGKNGIGGICKNGLPNFVNAKKQEDIPLEIFTIDSACNIVKFYSTECCDNAYFWDFGDSTYSSDKNPTHTYAANGTYNVTLYTSNNILYKTITIGIDEPVISGDTLTNCDSANIYIYSCSNQNNYYSYDWSVNNGDLITVDYLNNAYVRWTQNGTLTIVAHNKATGCKDSSTLQLTALPILYNYIDTPVAGCQNDTPDVILGFSPTGGYGSGTYSYQWYVSTDTGMVKTWSLISGATDSSYQPGINTAQRWFKRVVTSGTCEVESNVSYTSFIQYNNTIARDTSDCDDIIGSTPAASSFSYSWQRSLDSTNWTNIPSQTGKDMTAPVYFRTTYVRRVVQDSVCTSYSNVLTMQPSITTTVTATEDTICPGNELDVNGSTPCSENATIAYLWQFMTPEESEFTDLGGFGVYADLYDDSWSTECYLRRRSVSAGDTLYSDTVYITSRELIDMIFPLSNVPYLYNFCSGENVPELDGSQPCNLQNNWVYQWQDCTDTTNNSWSNISIDAVGNNYNPAELYQTTYYRRRAINTSTSEITYTPIFTMLMREPQITQQPTNVNVNEGNHAQFTVAFNDMQVVKWQQSYVSSGVTFYSDITDSDNDTLVVKADHCRHGKKYVAILQNLCTLGQLYSDTATLSVTAYNYDLWSKDNDLDNRSEPSGGFIWNSPDIWNRRSNDAGTVHQNAEHRVSAPNYVYVKVRNIGGSGQHASVPSKVYLYWTFANTGEKWTKHWVHDFDADSITGNWRTYQGVKHALGSLISILDLSALNAGADTTMYVPWYPPNPGVINNGTDTVNADVCFLSRIVTCEEAPYGMVIHPEVADVGFNVRYNNNIITKNFVVYDTLAGNGKTRWGGNGNPADDARIGRLVFTADNCDYFDYGTVLLHLDAGMQEAWYANGANGSGFTILNDSTLQIDTCVAVLDEILYSANQQAWLGVQFDESVGVPITEEINEFFTFNLQEYFDVEDEDTSVGGIVYGVPVLLYPPESGESQRRNTPVKDTKANQLAFSAFPNPFNNVLKVVYSLPKDENVTITLTNLLGQTIQTVEQNEFQTAGIHRLEINTANLTEGIYFITFKAGNEIKQKKIVLIR